MNQTQTIKKNTRVELYDWIRVIATIFVVIGHAAYLKIVTANGGINYILPSQLSPTYNGFLLSSFRFLAIWVYTFHMPLFFFLSGAVLGLKPIGQLFSFIKSKTHRLIIPYLLVALFFMFPIKYLGNFYTYSGLSKAIISFFTGFGGSDEGHLWFLIALFWCLIIFVCITKILDKLHSNHPIIILFICIIVSQFSIRYITFSFLQISTSLYYIQWLALGYLFESCRRRYTIPYSYSILISIFIILIYLLAYRIISPHYNISIIAGIIFSIALSVVLSPLFQLIKNKYSMHYNNFIKRLFDIYLFHDPLEYIIIRIFLNKNLLSTSIGCYAYLFMRTIGIILLSIMIGNIIEYVLKRISSHFSKTKKLITDIN
ncbi:acyltransferase family protein [Solobacterium sp.]|uniref:acyltransferase family protein n=1 Tax=Solobacterium sp. TaxID=2060878 RepID=UPI001CB23AE8|nr:acyltransferase family protein [Solobacterium sp.]MBF1086300.1 acyltransferase family protein [Solobacterium sp.]